MFNLCKERSGEEIFKHVLSEVQRIKDEGNRYRTYNLGKQIEKEVKDVITRIEYNNDYLRFDDEDKR